MASSDATDFSPPRPNSCPISYLCYPLPLCDLPGAVGAPATAHMQRGLWPFQPSKNAVPKHFKALLHRIGLLAYRAGKSLCLRLWRASTIQSRQYCNGLDNDLTQAEEASYLSLSSFSLSGLCKGKQLRVVQSHSYLFMHTPVEHESLLLFYRR